MDNPGTMRFCGSYRALSKNLVAGRFIGRVYCAKRLNSGVLKTEERYSPRCNYTRNKQGKGVLKT